MILVMSLFYSWILNKKVIFKKKYILIFVIFIYNPASFPSFHGVLKRIRIHNTGINISVG